MGIKVGIADIRANVDAFYADQIDVETFRARQEALWTTIEAQGSAGQTLAAIRRSARVARI